MCLTEEDYYEDDEEDDPDALKDPLYQVDLQVRARDQEPGSPAPVHPVALGQVPVLLGVGGGGASPRVLYHSVVTLF